MNGRTDFRPNFADFRNFSGPYDGHTYSLPLKKTRKRTDGPGGIKKTTDGHGLHLGIPWPSLVRDWEPPNSVKDIRSFLGFANYYRRFVPGYAGIASPLTLLTRKNIEWHWGLVQRRAFSDLKSALCNALLLVFPNPKLPYTVVTDASVDSAGGVLMQDQGDGLRPVAFMIRALKPTEQRYSAYEREMAAVAYCCI